MIPCEKLKNKKEEIEKNVSTNIKNKFKIRWLDEDLVLMSKYCSKEQCPKKSCLDILRLHETVYKAD